MDLFLCINPTKRVLATWNAAFHATADILKQFGYPDAVREDSWTLADYTLYRDPHRHFAPARHHDAVPHIPGVAVLAGSPVERAVYDPILAAALYLERRYAPDALFHGRLAGAAPERVRSVVGQYRPICTDGPALLNLLKRHYRSQPVPPGHFRALFLGNPVSMYTAAETTMDTLFVNSLFTEELQEYASLLQLGAGEVVRSFFEATGDPARLVSLTDLANLAKPGGFTRPLVLQALCRGGITVKQGAYRVCIHNRVAPFPDSLLTTDITELMPEEHLTRSVHRDALLHFFASLEPSLKSEFAGIIRNEEAKYRRCLSGRSLG
jgi:hypothetical protein